MSKEKLTVESVANDIYHSAQGDTYYPTKYAIESIQDFLKQIQDELLTEQSCDGYISTSDIYKVFNKYIGDSK